MCCALVHLHWSFVPYLALPHPRTCKHWRRTPLGWAGLAASLAGVPLGSGPAWAAPAKALESRLAGAWSAGGHMNGLSAAGWVVDGSAGQVAISCAVTGATKMEHNFAAGRQEVACCTMAGVVVPGDQQAPEAGTCWTFAFGVATSTPRGTSCPHVPK